MTDFPYPNYEEIKIRTRGNLPHWEFRGGIYFITFRLADSIPKNIVDKYREERERIVKRSKQQGIPLSKQELKRLRELFDEKIEKYLQAGRGACWMSRPEIAKLMQDSLRYFDSQRYQLYSWCIMPNHIHAVMSPFAEMALDDLLHSWKSYTAHEANKLLNRRGRFWQKEYYDHLIRDENDLLRTTNYIIENPKQANLTNWPWVWVKS
jgi:REP element-mobilizing transposase RayT